MAIIKEIGTISFLGEIKSGVSQNGNPWANRQVVFDVEGYNGSWRKVLVLAGTDRLRDLEPYPIGSRLEFGYQVRARQHEGKWYNNVELFTVSPVDGAQPYPQPPVDGGPAPRIPSPDPYPQRPAEYVGAVQGAETALSAPQGSRVAQVSAQYSERATRAQNGPQKAGRRRPPVQSRPQIPPQPVTGQEDSFDDFPEGF